MRIRTRTPTNPPTRAQTLGFWREMTGLRQRRLLMMLAAITLSGCTYGPAVTRGRILGVSRVPESRVMAVLVHRETIRPPTGLSTFPDGGAPKVLHQELQVCRYDADQRLLEPLLLLRPAQTQRIRFEGRLEGWQGEDLYLMTSGCPPTWNWNRGCGPREETHEYFRMDSQGKAERVAQVPQGLREGWNSPLVPREGELNYARISTGWDHVALTTTGPDGFGRQLDLEPEGKLVLTPRR